MLGYSPGPQLFDYLNRITSEPLNLYPSHTMQLHPDITGNATLQLRRVPHHVSGLSIPAIPKKFYPFANAIAIACHHSREHSAEVKAALVMYGDGNGVQISGVIRDHFPDFVKESLRLRCAAISAVTDHAWKVRPPRVQRHTLLTLQSRIVHAVGTGFYGPK